MKLSDFPNLYAGILAWFVHPKFPKAPMQAPKDLFVTVNSVNGLAGASEHLVNFTFETEDADSNWFVYLAGLSQAIADNEGGAALRRVSLSIEHRAAKEFGKGYSRLFVTINIIALEIRVASASLTSGEACKEDIQRIL